MLVKDNPAQLVYYQAGIGTYTIPQVATPLMAKISKGVDMMFGGHLSTHVMGGYKFLMQNYKQGDKICLFGFSRGAYTARALAGMVHSVGIIPRCNYEQVPFAYHMYERNDRKGRAQSVAFKKAFSLHVRIEFVGVWDTVSSVGIIYPRRLPLTDANESIKFFRHALSLDERRVRFKPSTWHWKCPNTKDKCRVKHDEMPHSFWRNLLKRQDNQDNINNNKSHHHDQCQSLPEQRVGEVNLVEEVWFAGHHCDVGGGAVKNGTPNSLARIPLRWMIRECFKAEVGILFQQNMFKAIGMDPATLYPSYERPEINSPCPSTLVSQDLTGHGPEKGTDPTTLYDYFEEIEDMADAVSPKKDELNNNWGWWILEYFPQAAFYQGASDSRDATTWTINKASGRDVPHQHQVGVKVHRSVKIRMEADFLKEGKYRPNAKLEVEPKWVA
ncbi:hypothetical protein K503DRAFT_742348 [Rhizopogon vinicolor AM-OR11-026]|uniref:T6SS Phospholipase effector Tle1-like catalytic domain-containing protein n=1 Tax=Rhizopogon vinicolor AM-OR11-026 TaxID=1314800 RepID=A0A1B7MYN1_9AGAM|nr:hypothetical protein K503DRAFT_742348 [Rhizopogon vinicolor AM-OR11-026]